ncbi:hypothetical protein ACTMU2_00685 [Cupriavidus basilensis]
MATATPLATAPAMTGKQPASWVVPTASTAAVSAIRVRREAWEGSFVMLSLL